MTSKSKAKGTYHEKWFEKLFQSWGIKVKRQPLSGSLGGEYAGDLVIELKDLKLISEVKYRKEKGFPSPFRVLEGRDIAFYKQGNPEPGSPRWIMIVPDVLVERFVNDYLNKRDFIDTEEK